MPPWFTTVVSVATAAAGAWFAVTTPSWEAKCVAALMAALAAINEVVQQHKTARAAQKGVSSST